MKYLLPLGIFFVVISRPAVAQSKLERIRPSNDHTHFVGAKTGKRFVVWGVNYDHDDAGRLLEDYWDKEWDTVVEDFREIRALGANVVRVHLQFAKFIEAPDRVNAANLARFVKLVKLSEETGLYLDVTGLGCYHKKDVPAWYDTLDESARWDAQERFWQAIAKAGKGSPAIFCYDLMNEPVLAGDKKDNEWLAGELGGKHFVQRITRDSAGRTREEVAKQWVKKLTTAIRAIDDKPMLTVGVIPWAHVFKGAKPLFYAPGVGDPLDFVSVHFYPKKGDVPGSLAALKVYEIGKPLVVEEIFPLGCSIEEAGAFIDGSRPFCDGWVGFYWGKTIAANEKAGDLKGAVVAAWLKWFRDHSGNGTRWASIPDSEGFAGSFAGTSGGALLVAGGANFPDRKPWEGGTKVWTDKVFVLEKPDGPWKIAGRLPRPLGYGVCATHGDSLVIVGGSDANRHHADAFRLSWKQGRLDTTALAPLPKPLANACGAIVGDVLYVAGGLESPNATEALAGVYSLDLGDRNAKWNAVAPLPGRGRMLAMAAGFDGTLWIAGGIELNSGPDGQAKRAYLKDAYRYDAKVGWKRIADLPRPLAAAAAFADGSGVAILGGDDGTQVGVAPQKHRGFRSEILRNDAKADRWIESDQLTAPRVTVPVARWRDRWVVPGGEVRPGIRSPEVWSMPAAKEK